MNKTENFKYGFPVVYQKSLITEERWIAAMEKVFTHVPEEAVADLGHLVAGWYRLKSAEEGVSLIQAVRTGTKLEKAAKDITTANRSKPKTATELISSMTAEQLAEMELKIKAQKEALSSAGLLKTEPTAEDTVQVSAEQKPVATTKKK